MTSVSCQRAATRDTPSTTAQSPKATADVVIRAGAIDTMAPGRPTMRAIAIGGGKVLAVGEAAHDLDGFVGGSTHVIDDPALTLLPGFIDTHTHGPGSLRWVMSDRVRRE